MGKQELKALKIAIVHDWLYGGGSERVVYELHKMFPDAPIFTSYCSPEWRQKLDGKVVTGFLQHWPFSKLRKFLPVLRIWWFTHLRFNGYDLVISSSGNGEAKGIRVPKGTMHICYCHSPTHFYWRHYEEYLKQPGFGMLNPIVRLGLKVLVGPLRRWDLRASQRPDYFIANSTHIQADIKRYYGRDSVVIHPPVEVARFALPEDEKVTPRSGFLTVSRLVPYKRVDIVVAACTQLNLPLTVVGRGPDYGRLKRLAGPSVVFDLDASDQAVAAYMRACNAFVFAAFEDFGITPVEALAAGTPVIAYKAGGALDYITPDKTGAFFEPQSTTALVHALKVFDPKHYDHAAIVKTAQRFSLQSFSQNMEDFLKKTCLLT